MKKLPYGVSSFDKIKSENYYFVDKTRYIQLIEELKHGFCLNVWSEMLTFILKNKSRSNLNEKVFVCVSKFLEILLNYGH